MTSTRDHNHLNHSVFLEAGKCVQKSCPNVCLDCAGVVKLHVQPSRKEVKKGPKFRGLFDLSGDSLQRWQKWPPRCAQRVPKERPSGPQCRPGNAQTVPKGAHGCPPGAQSVLKRWPRVSKGAHLVRKGCSKGGQGRPGGAPGSPKGAQGVPTRKLCR